MFQKHIVLVLLQVMISVVLVSEGFTGELDPPPGPVMSTMKPLDEVEPRVSVNSLEGNSSAVHVIDQPGSYYLVGDLTGEPGKNGIEISSDNVSLDLNGFSLVGVDASLSGVIVTEPRENIIIRNGFIRNWGEDGINGRETINGLILKLVVASDNVRFGASCKDGFSVLECQFLRNRVHGFIAGAFGLIQSSVFVGNDSDGVNANSNTEVIDCVFESHGATACFVYFSGLMKNCTSRANNVGFWTVQQGTVESCLANDNNEGITVGENSRALNNFAFNNNKGIKCDAAGVHIEGNTLTKNRVGISVTGRGNLILKNRATNSETTNFDIGPDNTYGPIVDASGVGELGLNSNGAHPFANFSY